MAEPDEVFWLETPQHLELLSNVTRLEIIEHLHRPATVGEVAEAMGVPRTRLYHHVNALLEGGMIREAGSRRSGARTEKLYQASALGFRPAPAFLKAALPREKAQAMIRSVVATAEADFTRAVESGIARLDDDQSQRQVRAGRTLTFLTDDQLHSLITELDELLERYDYGEPVEGARVVGILTMVYPSSRTAR